MTHLTLTIPPLPPLTPDNEAICMLRIAQFAGNNVIAHMESYGDNCGCFITMSGAGGTPEAPTATPDQKILGYLTSAGFDGPGAEHRVPVSGSIYFYAEGVWTPTSHGTAIKIFTCKEGEHLTTERLEIDGDGRWVIEQTMTFQGDIPPNKTLHVKNGFITGFS